MCRNNFLTCRLGPVVVESSHWWWYWSTPKHLPRRVYWYHPPRFHSTRTICLQRRTVSFVVVLLTTYATTFRRWFVFHWWWCLNIQNEANRNKQLYWFERYQSDFPLKHPWHHHIDVFAIDSVDRRRYETCPLQ